MKKMVVVYTLAYAPLVGGAEIALREVMKRLKDKYDFIVITAKLQKGNVSGFVDGIKVNRLGLGFCLLDKVLFLPLATLYSLFVKADLYFGLLENQAGLTALFMSKIKGKPCIINLQSGDSEQYIYGKLGVLGFLYNWVYGKRARYVVLSNYLKQRAITHGVPKENITIIPNGVDTKIFVQQNKIVPNHNILTVSRLVYKNGVDTLIKAFSKVQKEHPSCTLTICGSGEEEVRLKELVSELGISFTVFFVGNVDYHKLPSYYNNSIMFVRPSRSEGFGNSFIEAMSCGIPIIGTREGGIPDFLVDGKTGLFCKMDDPVDLSEKMILLLKDERLRDKIVKNGLELSKNYDWNIIANKFDDEFKKLVEVGV